jgi:hypothetical protein
LTELLDTEFVPQTVDGEPQHAVGDHVVVARVRRWVDLQEVGGISERLVESVGRARVQGLAIGLRGCARDPHRSVSQAACDRIERAGETSCSSGDVESVVGLYKGNGPAIRDKDYV